ncbi:MAG: LysR family transcriptional regulator [Lachnospiraceae bacterium]|nr:LysR family transcriptional regulator [Lachnospiraceae bacterium]
MDFNLEYYRTFLMTANLLSFTKAANALYLTQSAVSQTIKKLENELGCVLFDRTPHGLKLTKEGELLYGHVKKAFEELKAGENRIIEGKGARELKIGATETSLRYILPPVIKKYKEIEQETFITFAGSTTVKTCEYLQTGEIELAVLIDPLPEGYSFLLEEIGRMQDVCAAARDYEIRTEEPLTMSELSDYPLITVSPENNVRRFYDNLFAEKGAIPAPSYVVRSTGLILPLVQSGLGIGIIPEPYVREGIEKGELKQIMTKETFPERKIYAAVRGGARLSEQAGIFLELLKKEYN